MTFAQVSDMARLPKEMELGMSQSTSQHTLGPDSILV
jgi:hypothetical protein